MVRRVRMLACLVLPQGLRRASRPTKSLRHQYAGRRSCRRPKASKDFGDYVLYFNALNTDQLTPEIAREYEHRPQQEPRAAERQHPSQARRRSTGSRHGRRDRRVAINLNGQLKTMTLREVREGDGDLLHRRARDHGRRSVDLHDRRDAEQRSEPLHGPVQEAVLRRRVQRDALSPAHAPLPRTLIANADQVASAGRTRARRPAARRNPRACPAG